MIRVYIAGALAAPAEQYIHNLSLMTEEAEQVRKAGFSVYHPGLIFLMGFKFGNWTYRDYFDNSQEWLKVSQAVYVCPNSQNSKGTQAEIKTAEELGIPIFHNLEDLIQWRKQLKNQS